jgi:hypothetical protein
VKLRFGIQNGESWYEVDVSTLSGVTEDLHLFEGCDCESCQISEDFIDIKLHGFCSWSQNQTGKCVLFDEEIVSSPRLSSC